MTAYGDIDSPSFRAFGHESEKQRDDDVVDALSVLRVVVVDDAAETLVPADRRDALRSGLEIVCNGTVRVDEVHLRGVTLREHVSAKGNMILVSAKAGAQLRTFCSEGRPI